ncbi:MAG TPA: hypothetical protein VGQ27_14245, partial [Steroidobacteraceae bacterium]|nr:hypothetical protein [Steroidobacteraceae bacterium]
MFGRVLRLGNIVVRDTGWARPWARRLARHLMRREYRALTRLALGRGIDGIPRALSLENDKLTREWIEGTPMHLA